LEVVRESWDWAPPETLGIPLERLDRDAELLQHGHRAALGLPEQGSQQVGGLDLAVSARPGQGLSLGQGLLALDRELVESHGGIV